MKAHLVVPGVPAAGHLSPGGYWHPGRVEGCVKCPTLDPPARRVPLSAVVRCPHHSLSPGHYRDDGNCRCTPDSQVNNG